MQIQETRTNTNQDTDSDHLLSKKAESEDGVREMEITDSSWSFRPVVTYETPDKQTQNVPTLDKIASVVVQNKQDINVKPDEETDAISEDENERLVDLYNQLLRYSFSENYVSEVTPHDAIDADVSLQPYLFLQLESSVDEEVYVAVENPFRQNEISKLLSATESNQTVKLTYESGDPVLTVNEQEYGLAYTQIVGEYKSLDMKIMKSLSEFSDVDEFLRSEHDGWAEISVDSVENKGNNTLIETEGDNLDWQFDEPLIWDESEEPIVKLLENYANGDKQQLDSIYVRPTNPTVKNNNTLTKTHEEMNWEIALEEPKTESSDDFATSVFLAIQMTLLLLMASLFMFLMFYILASA